VWAVLGVGAAAAGTVLFLAQTSQPALPSGLSLWLIDDSTKVRPGDALGAPVSVSAAPAVELEAAAGETVAFQLVLASPQAATGLSLERVDLSGPAGSIPREEVQVFLESYIVCPSVPRELVSEGPGEYPDPLIPLPARFSIAAGRKQPLWIDVHVPRQSRAGRYSGRLRVLGDAAGPRAVTLAVTVHPFALPATPSLSAWVPLYAGHLQEGERTSEDDRELLWAYYRMAHDHRFVTQIAEEEPRIGWDEATGRLLEADWRSYDARNGPALDGTLFADAQAPALWKVGGFMGWGQAFGGTLETDREITPARRRALTEYAGEIARHFKQRDWSRPRLFMYLIDEPDLAQRPALTGVVKQYGDAIHEAKAGIAHLVTVSPDGSSLQGSVDIWATWGAGFSPAAMRSRQALGERAWFYQQHEPFVGGHCLNHEGLGLRSWGWIAWRYGVDGVFLWVGNFWNKDPYRDPRTWDERQLGNGVLFYPGRQLSSLGYPPLRGPVSSFRMKALRRGLQDYEYFKLLREAGGDPDALVSQIVRSALGDGGRTPHWRHPRWADHGDWSHQPSEWDRVRREVARQITIRKAS
jgi:hypothetical protein